MKLVISNLKNKNLLTLKTENSLLEEKIKTPEFHLLPSSSVQENLYLFLLIPTLAEFQNLLIITYNLR